MLERHKPSTHRDRGRRVRESRRGFRDPTDYPQVTPRILELPSRRGSRIRPQLDGEGPPPDRMNA